MRISVTTVWKDRLRAVVREAHELPEQPRLLTEGIAAARRKGLLAMSTVAGLEQATKVWRLLRGHRPMSVLLAGVKRHVNGIDQKVNANRVPAWDPARIATGVLGDSGHRPIPLSPLHGS